MTERGARRALASLEAGFGRAAAAAEDELTEARLTLAGRPVRFRIVGRDLAKLILTPLAPLVEPRATETGAAEPGAAGTPELEVGLWDGERAGVVPDGPFPEEVISVDSETGPVVVGRAEGALSAIDRSAARIVGWRRSASAVLIEEYWRPLPQVLPFWYLDRGVSIVHAAMASRDGEGVLIVGPSGAGKSTTALACAAAGLRMVGDDQVGVEVTGGGYRAHMLYGTGRVFTATFDQNPFLANGGSAEELRDGKVMVSPPPERLARSARVRGIVVLRTGAAANAITEVSPGEALLACAPYSLVGVVGGARYGMERIAAMVRRLPLRRIEVAGGPREAAELVSATLAKLSAA